MFTKISQNLKTQEIWANGVELASIMGHDRNKKRRILTFPESEKELVHTFKNPVLLTDNYKIGQLKPEIRDTIFSLFSNKPRIVEYDNVSVRSDESHINVWCPSIDTILFAKALSKLFNKKNNYQSVLEIGCGSGFLSKYALAKSKTIKSLLIIDINKYAIKCAMDNINDKRALFYTGDGLKKIKNGKFDLMICNPPYVPRQSSIDDNPYEGVSVLNYLIHEGQKHLNKNGVIITNISSLCWDIVLKQKPTLKMTILEKMEVPLKVNNIMNNKKWLNYLLQKRHLQKKSKKGYNYWQKIYIVKLENK